MYSFLNPPTTGTAYPSFQVSREVTLLAVHGVFVAEVAGSSATIAPALAGIGVLHGGQQMIADEPQLLAGDLPDDWPAVCPMICYSSDVRSNDSHRLWYTGVLASKGKRRLRVGEGLYLSSSSRSGGLGAPLFHGRVLIGYR